MSQEPIQKLYFHFDAPQFTSVLKFHASKGITVRDGLVTFAARFNKKHGSEQRKLNGDELAASHGPTLTKGQRILSSSPLSALIDRQDVYVVHDPQANAAAPVKRKAAGGKYVASEDPVNVTNAAQLVAEAKELEKKGRIVAALKSLREALKLTPKDTKILEYKGRLDYDRGEFEDALDTFHVVEKLVSKKGRRKISALLGQTYFRLGEHRDAIKYFQQALKLAKGKTRDDYEAWIARIMYDQGPQQQDQACRIYEQIFTRNQDHIEALLGYCIAAADRGQAVESIPHALKAVVNSQQQKVSKDTKQRVGRHFASLIDRKNGAKDVLAQLGMAAKTMSAVAFLATVAKDNGAVDQSIVFYEHCVKMAPQSQIAALNLIHTYEVVNDYRSALERAKEFIKGQNLMIGPLKAHEFYKVIKDIELKNDTLTKSGKAWQEFDKKISTDDWKNPAYAGIFDPDASNKNAKKPPYTEDQLSLLAVYMTVVKLLYVKGVLHPINTLIDMIHPIKADYALHLTSIRNEQAYYSCIVHLMRHLTERWMTNPSNPETSGLPAKPADYKKIYFCGDSHSLAPGWNTMKVKDEPRIIVPKLVTGLKCWHMRRESRFFPSKNFDHIVESIPRESEVIFNFGEIDCRESLVICVDKGRYPDLKTAMTKVIDIYISRMKSLVNRRKFKAYVHPVAPVLNVTRKNVSLFNEILDQKVKKESTLHWLDLQGRLTVDGGFNYVYALDGTHLSPKYVPLIENALNKL